MKTLYLSIVFLLCATSLHAQNLDPAAAALRAGESINGFPNWSERVLLEWINRARVDPQAEMSACGPRCAEAACYKPVAPLTWTEALNRSARFHADEMVRQGYFAHDSKCPIVSNINSLYPAGCDGSPSCACSGGALNCGTAGCTPWTGRIALFGGSPSGEIIAGTAEPDQAFYMWLFEGSSSASCGPNSANLHRYLILQSSGGVGVGVSGYAVGDFGGGSAPYRIASGSHYPQQAPSVDLWANWYDSNAPKAANAVVDGRCLPMSLKRGSKQNGAWSATATNVGSGCHRYYFSFLDSSGAEVTYPATGSLGIGCEDWNSSRALANCGTSSSPATPAPSTTARRRSVRR